MAQMILKRRGWALLLAAAIAAAAIVVWTSADRGGQALRDDPQEPAGAHQSASLPALSSAGDLQESPSLMGQMTLADIELRHGIPAREIAKRLHLPADAPEDETLGRLRQRYPFTMDEVKGIIAELRKESLPQDGSGSGTIPDRKPEQQSGVKPEEPKPATGRGSAEQAGVLVTGQTSLREIEKQTGIPAGVIAERLSLPPEVSHDMQLGKIRRMYPITMQQVREVISQLMKEVRP